MSKPRRQPLAHAIPQEDMIAALAEMATPVLSVPTAEMASWHMSMRQLASDAAEGTLLNGRAEVLPIGKLVGAWTRIADNCWPAWPPQESVTPTNPGGPDGRL